MSPLEAARKMLELGPFDGGGRWGEYYERCVFCEAEPEEVPPAHGSGGHPAQPHKPKCPWPLMPQIIEALEAPP